MSNDPNINDRAQRLGDAIADAFKLALRQAIARQLTESVGPGPWLLFPDGTVEFPEPSHMAAPGDVRSLIHDLCKHCGEDIQRVDGTWVHEDTNEPSGPGAPVL